jgi:opacity protein-like surface antigen
MKRLMTIVAVLVVVCISSLAAEAAVRVRGYSRSNGTYVQPHYRSNPDGNFYNNWSTYPNINPYTGTTGTRRTPSYSESYSWRMPSLSHSTPSYWNDNSWSFPRSSPPSYSTFGRSLLGR